jgi:hypothetical protein
VIRGEFAVSRIYKKPKLKGHKKDKEDIIVVFIIWKNDNQIQLVG